MTNPVRIVAALALFLTVTPALADEPAPADAEAAPKAPKKAAKKAKANKADLVEEKAEAPSAVLLAPEQATATAPKEFKVKFLTTKGEFVIEVHRDWSPRGADRFFNLVKAGYFNGVGFFRVVAGFMVQFGIQGSPEINGKWREARIDDDPPAGQSNTRGMVSFATAGPNTRTTQMFINFGNNARLDGMGFTPFGKVAKGLEVVDSLYAGYGEGAPGGRGPHQGRLNAEGNAYLKSDFPELDYVKKATVAK